MDNMTICQYMPMSQEFVTFLFTRSSVCTLNHEDVLFSLYQIQIHLHVSVLSLQVKSGTIFDNFLITDDVKEAEDFGNETWGATKVRDAKLHWKSLILAHLII